MTVTGVLGYYLGYRGLALIFLVFCVPTLAFVIGVSVHYHLRPPKARIYSHGKYVELNITGRRRRGSGH